MENTTWIINLTFMALIVFAWILCPKRYRLGNALPAVMVTIGILGTFVGIQFGLWNFDASDVQSSIPDLLGGLTTAFFTSIVGMLAALALRFCHVAGER